MRLLFAISIASFCTVLWIALSLARRIQRERLRKRRAPRVPAVEIFESGDYRTPRSIKLNQQVASMRNRRAPAPDDSAVHDSPPAASAPAAYSPEPAAAFLELAPSGPTRYLRPVEPASSSANISPASVYSGEAAAHSGQIIDCTLQLVKPRPIAEPIPSASTGWAESISAGTAFAARPDSGLSGARKSPRSTRSGTFRRVDLSHYNNEDMGDLTDPYTHIVRPSGVRSAAKSI